MFANHRVCFNASAWPRFAPSIIEANNLAYRLAGDRSEFVLLRSVRRLLATTGYPDIWS